MVSKKTGRPPGRPRKVESSQTRDRGRPPLPFFEDQERYLIAFLDAMTVLQKNNQRQAAQLIAALEVGHQPDPADVPDSVRANLPEGMALVGWRIPTVERACASKAGSRAATVEGRLKSLCKKSREAWGSEPGVGRWRVHMAKAFLIAFVPNGNPYREIEAKLEALQVGELDYAERKIVPLIRAQDAGEDVSPGFIGNLGSTTNGNLCD